MSIFRFGYRSLLVALAVLACPADTRGAKATGFALDVDAQPLQFALVSGLDHPGRGEKTFADTAAGARVRADIFFLHLEFDFQHFMAQQLDWIHAGIGYELVFPASGPEQWGTSRFTLRPQAGLLVLGGPDAAGEDDYQTQTGVRAGATLGWELYMTSWLALGIDMDLGFIYLVSNGCFGYTVGVFATVGLRM